MPGRGLRTCDAADGVGGASETLLQRAEISRENGGGGDGAAALRRRRRGGAAAGVRRRATEAGSPGASSAVAL